MWWRFWRRRRTKAPQGDIIRSDAAPPPVTASPTEGRIGPSKLVGAYGWLIDAASAQSLDEAVDQGDGVAIAISASGGFASWGQWEFAAPGVSLQGAQKFRIRAFCSVSGGRWQAILCQAGAVVRDLGMASHQRAGAYEVLEWYWDATEVTGVSNVQIRLLPQRDRADGYYSLDAVEWAYSASGAKPEPPTVPQPVEPGQGVTTGELPLPVRTLRAATLDELLRLLASAQPGDHIVLADGTYRPSGGRLQISCVGSADAPIVIRAQNILGAKLPLGFQFAPTSKYCWLWGIDFKDAQNSVLSGRGHVVRRCRIWPLPDFTSDVRGILVENGSDCRVDYSEIRLYTLAELASLFPGRDWSQGVTYSGISGNTSYAGNNRFDRLTVERCLFKGGIDRPNEYSRPSTSLFSNHGGIQEDMTQNYRHEWTVRLCRVESESGTNILNNNNSGNLLDRVHVVGHGRGVVKFRYTGYCKMDRCRLENCETEIMGGHHVIENSVITGGAWRIFAGTYAWNDASNAALNGYPQAYQVRLSRCAGTVIVGDNWGAAHTFAADGTKIEAHRSGTVTLVSGKQTNTTQPSSTNVPDLAAITIPPQEVGCFAFWSGETGAELPPPTRTVSVANASELTNAVANALPGDHIVLANGTYNLASALTISKSGTAENPIVIRAANVMQAVIPKGFLYNAGVSHVWLYGLDFKDAVGSWFRGFSNKIRRCRFWPKPVYTADGWAVAVCAYDGADGEISYCELRMHTRAEAQAENSGLWGANTVYGVIWSYFDNNQQKPFYRLKIARCLLTGGPHDVPYSQPNCQFIEAACNQPSMGYDVNCDWTIQDCYGDVPRNSTLIDFKCRGIKLIRSHIISPVNGSYQLREGRDHKIDRCRLVNGSVEVTRGPGNLIANSTFATLYVMAGQLAYNQLTDASKHGQSYKLIVANSSGYVKVGHQYDSTYTYPAVETLIEQHSGTIDYGNHQSTAVSDVLKNSGVTAANPVTMTAAEVGPYAPWAGV